METNGTLYVVSTPIGNLGDLSSRAIETLRSVDIIACEDTRRTLKLCHYLDIKKPLISYYRENERHKFKILLDFLSSGKNIALVSDAGTPAISDPGSILVREARKSKIQIVAVAGPSSLTAAISIAGLSQSQFYFGGFPDSSQSKHIDSLRQLATLSCPLVFFISPHRIHATLADMIAAFGDRPALLFRELTKIHEECTEGTLSSLVQHYQNGIKGEIVLIFEGKSVQEEKPDDFNELVLWYRDHLHASLKDTAKQIALDLGISRSEVYRQALSIWHKDST